MRTLKILGNGYHHIGKVLDAETGEDLGAQLGIRRMEYRIGDKDGYPNPVLVLEVSCPVIFEHDPKLEAEIRGEASAKSATLSGS